MTSPEQETPEEEMAAREERVASFFAAQEASDKLRAELGID